MKFVPFILVFKSMKEIARAKSGAKSKCTSQLFDRVQLEWWFTIC
jgi:hypothetical protein